MKFTDELERLCEPLTDEKIEELRNDLKHTAQGFGMFHRINALCDQAKLANAAPALLELVRAAEQMTENCAQCWGNGYELDTHDEQVDCPVCTDTRAALSRLEPK